MAGATLVPEIRPEGVPARPMQPDTALLVTRMSPEILDIIVSCSLPDSDPPTSRRRPPNRSSELKSLNLISHGISLCAARHLWRHVVLTNDNDTSFVQNAIDAWGGRQGRVGSSIRTIYTIFHFTKFPEAVVTLASSCFNLLRLDAPIYNFTSLDGSLGGPLHRFYGLQELVLFGSKTSTAFKLGGLSRLATLKYLTVDTKIEIAPKSPPPSFSLLSLVWKRKHQPEEVRWTLQSSPALQVLMLSRPLPNFLKDCLVQHGDTLLSLRLLLQGMFATEKYSELIDMVRAYCPIIRELLWDICPDPRLFERLPPTIKHLGLKPGSKTTLFNGETFVDWINERGEVELVTLWGTHTSTLIHRTDNPFPSKHKRQNLHVRKAREWRESTLLAFVPQGPPKTWPFEDKKTADFISPVVADRRCR